MSYLVMECRAGYAVVLDNQGRFQKVPNLGYEVGETLDFVTIFPEETAAVTPFRKKMASLVAAAACFLLLFAGSHQLLLTAYGTVRIQINPDVMLEINRLDYVIGLEGMNEDGSRLVERYRYRGKRLESVSEELADLAMEEGYLRDGGEIVLTVESKHEKWKSDKEAELTERISTHLENKASVKVSVGGIVRDSGAGDTDAQQGRQNDEMTGTPAGKPEQGNIGNPAAQTREGMEADFDDMDEDREGIDDDHDHDDADDDHDDIDDGRDDGEDNRDDREDDRDDDRDDINDGRDDRDDDRDDTDDGTDDNHDGTADDRDGADDNHGGAADDRDGADNHDDADNEYDNTDENHGGADNDRDDTDDSRENSDESREAADDGYDAAGYDSDSDDSDGSYDHDSDDSDSNEDSDD